jgi:excisionase family DNA binding protein
VRSQNTTKIEPVMTVKELADYLRVHSTTIYRLLRRGELPAFKIGSDWRFNRARIDAWMIDGSRTQPRASGRLRARS